MKYIYFFFAIIILSEFSYSQSSYENDIKSIVEKRINNYPKTGENTKHLLQIINAFVNAKKPTIDLYNKRNCGIGVVLSEDDVNESVKYNDPIIAPASYNYENSKIGISAVRNKNNSEPLNTYVNTYIHNYPNIIYDELMGYLSSNKVPAYGDVNSSSKEIIIQEKETTSYLRGDKDWMYIISIDSNYKNLKTPRIIIFAFRNTFDGVDIFKDSKNESIASNLKHEQEKKEQLKKENRLYHNYALDEMRKNLIFLSKVAPYKSNTTFIKNVSALPDELNRYNISEYIDELKYFMNNFSISKEDKKKYSSPFNYSSDIININHISAHSLGDVYMSKGLYKEAIKHFELAKKKHLYERSSGTSINKDHLRLLYDLAEANIALKQNNSAYDHLLTVMLNGQSSDSYVSKTFTNYTKEEDLSKLKAAIDKAMNSLKKEDSYSYSYTFRNIKTSFGSFYSSKEKAIANVYKSEFYKKLPSKPVDIPIKKVYTPKTITKSNEKPYHINELDVLVKSLKLLEEKEQFKNNKAFIDNVDSFHQKIKSNNLNSCEKELNYFYLYVYVTKDMKGNLNDSDFLGLENIKHLSGHLLADVYLANGKNLEALSPLLMMESSEYFSYKSDQNEVISKDKQIVRKKLAEVYLSIQSNAPAISYLLALIVDNESFSMYADNKILELLQKIGKEEMNEYMNQLFSNLEVTDNKNYNLKLKYTSIQLTASKDISKEEIIQIIKNTKFYKSLKK